MQLANRSYLFRILTLRDSALSVKDKTSPCCCGGLSRASFDGWCRAEEKVAEELVKRQARRDAKPTPLGADKRYDSVWFVANSRDRKFVVLHAAASMGRRSGLPI
jgi:hypothetical protein